MKYKYIIIERTPAGWRIKDDESGGAVHFVGYSERGAVKAFRARFNLKYKHLEKIYI